jgi:hypothetical protein
MGRGDCYRGGANRLEEEAAVLVFLRGPCAIARTAVGSDGLVGVMRCGM